MGESNYNGRRPVDMIQFINYTVSCFKVCYRIYLYVLHDNT